MSEAAPEGTGPAGTGTEGTITPPVLPGTTQGTAPKTEETDYKAEAEKLRTELQKLRKVEDQVKALRPKAQRFDELQQSVMTAEEKAQAAIEAANVQVSEATARATTAERELAVLRAGIDNRLEKEDLVFLEGVPVDKIAEAAKTLAKRLGKADTPGFDGGARTPPPANQDMGTFLAQQIDRARGRR